VVYWPLLLAVVEPPGVVGNRKTYVVGT